MLKQKNTKKQGDVGIGDAIAYFTGEGYTVSIPLTDSQSYDLLVDMNGSIKKIQVKTSTVKENSGSYTVGLRGVNTRGRLLKKFDKSLVDYVFVLTEESRYLIPANTIKARWEMCVGESTKQFRV